MIAVHCALRLSDGEPANLPDFAPGTEITGRVLVGGRPAPNVRISVLPTSLASRRPFTLPLTWDREAKALTRSVHTDPEGTFHSPPLAPADYLLEIVPQGGRLLTAGPFSVPAPERLLARGEHPTEVQAVWDLGEPEVSDPVSSTQRATIIRH